MKKTSVEMTSKTGKSWKIRSRTYLGNALAFLANARFPSPLRSSRLPQLIHVLLPGRTPRESGRRGARLAAVMRRAALRALVESRRRKLAVSETFGAGTPTIDDPCQHGEQAFPGIP